MLQKKGGEENRGKGRYGAIYAQDKQPFVVESVR